MRTGILELPIADVPIAVIDFETTGLSADYDRVVEVSIVRVDPGGRKRTLVLDTLVNPGRAVSASEIHGITDAMVKDAPKFRDIWPAMHSALSGCIVAAYNAYFDMRFLTAEAERAGDNVQVPYFCLMYLRSLIGVGERCTLDVACRRHGIRLTDAHRSARDAMATAELIPAYIQSMHANGLKTYQDLRQAGTHKYLQSFELKPLPPRQMPGRCELFPREKVQVRRGGVLSFLSRT